MGTLRIYALIIVVRVRRQNLHRPSGLTSHVIQPISSRVLNGPQPHLHHWHYRGTLEKPRNVMEWNRAGSIVSELSHQLSQSFSSMLISYRLQSVSELWADSMNAPASSPRPFPLYFLDYILDLQTVRRKQKKAGYPLLHHQTISCTQTWHTWTQFLVITAGVPSS